MYKNISVFLILIGSSAFAAVPFEEMESQVYEVQLSKQDIIKRAESCLVQNIHNDTIILKGSSNGYSGMFGGPIATATNTIPGGPVVTFKDPDSGTITATSRADLRAYMVNFSVQSTVTLMAKENKFKIKHSGIQILQKNSGYASNGGYQQLNTDDPSYEKAVATMTGLSSKITDCISTIPKVENW